MSDSTFESTSGTEALSDLHKGELAAFATQVADHRRQLKQSLAHLQECLDHLRLVAKYQAFDLEATRRENADLRTLLEIEDHPKQ